MPASPGCSVRSSSSSCVPGSFFGTIRYWMLGRSKLATKCRASVEVEPGGDLGVGRGRSPSRSARCAARRPALVQHRQRQVVGPEVVAPLGDAVRLVDREQRDLARGRAAASSPSTRERLRRQVEQVELAARGTPPRPSRRSSKSWVELRNPARTPSARQRVDLVLHQRDQRRDRPPRRRPGRAPGSGSTATCRRRSA